MGAPQLSVAVGVVHVGVPEHSIVVGAGNPETVSYTHLRAHETPEHLVCRLLLEKKNAKHWSTTRRTSEC